jgi:uncharacterized membrane protein (DUF441 family)
VSSWTLAIVLTTALLAGFCCGWIAGRAFKLRAPNVAIATGILVAGSLGGPLVTYTTLGASAWSHALALLLAGLATGVTFWPMGERQGRRQWL